MQLVKTQPPTVQEIVRPYVESNAYFCEPGMMLVAYLASDCEETRRFAINKILELREKPNKPGKKKVLKGIRQFFIPELKWEANKWQQMINWTDIEKKIFEPRILQKFSNNELMEAYAEPLSFPDYPVHSQSVERTVKLVSEASKVVVGEDNRHAHIVGVIAARKARPDFSSKKYYEVRES